MCIFTKVKSEQTCIELYYFITELFYIHTRTNTEYRLYEVSSSSLIHVPNACASSTMHLAVLWPETILTTMIYSDDDQYAECNIAQQFCVNRKLSLSASIWISIAYSFYLNYLSQTKVKSQWETSIVGYRILTRSITVVDLGWFNNFTYAKVS